MNQLLTGSFNAYRGTLADSEANKSELKSLTFNRYKGQIQMWVDQEDYS